MAAIVTVFAVIFLSLIVTRAATLVLIGTGLSRESARFQARSAFTGVGFTTTEAEMVVNHPIRRRVILSLMLFGNAGIVTVIATIIISFATADTSRQALVRAGVLLGGIFGIWLVARSRWLDRRLTKLIARLIRRYSDVDVSDAASLVNLSGNHVVMEVKVRPDGWLADKTVGELRLRDEGIVVLGISHNDGSYMGAPIASTPVASDDTLVVYGFEPSIAALCDRQAGPEGDRAHEAIAFERRRAQADH